MTKKILLIIGILVMVGVAVFLIFASKPQEGEGGRIGFSIREFLPFGRSDDGTSSDQTPSGTDKGETPTNQTPNVSTNQPVPRLRKISGEPVAGAVVFSVGTTSTVRFVEKGTGNVYEARSDSVAVTRLTNTTIPKIIRAFWLPNGSGFLAQTLMAESEIIETSFVKLNKSVASTTSENLTPFSTTIGKLPTDIKEIAIKPDGSKIFYYTINGSSDWFISNPDGTGRSLLMSHPLTEWLPKWVSANLIMMQNKGSSESIGYAYSFDVQKKTLKKTGVGLWGLSSNPNTDWSFSLVSSGGSFPQLFLVDNKNVFSSRVTTNTLAEKCVWLKEKILSVYCAIPRQIPSGNYPDVWYKGLVSTEDYVVKINVKDDVLYSIADPSSDSGEKIDVTDISISPDESHLIFRNKVDGHLWILRIGE